jgi:myo-inositol-1(or 4)-monophosphatase
MPDVMETLRAALAAGSEVLMRHLGKVEAEHKGAVDLVTVADRESEAVVIETIRAAFPGHAILAEESGARETEGAEWRWIIDPLDGTTNYAHAMPIFCVTIGVEHRGEIVAGGTLSPATDELFLAERGSGATRNGARIRVSECTDLDKALVVTGFPYDRREHIHYYMSQYGAFLQRSQGVLRLGAAGMDFAHVAMGRLDGYWERGLHPWDVAAGKLLIEEAGGRTSDFRGEPFNIFGPDFLASNGPLHEAMLAILADCPPWDG